MAHSLSCSAACRIFLDQGWNPCPLHWQPDSQPLRHEGSPKFIYFIYLFLAALGLHCCAWAFSSCGEQGPLFAAVHRLLIVVATLCCGAQALGARASVVVAHRLSCSVACGIFPDQGLNPCPLHWQPDS